MEARAHVTSGGEKKSECGKLKRDVDRASLTALSKYRSALIRYYTFPPQPAILTVADYLTTPSNTVNQITLLILSLSLAPRAPFSLFSGMIMLHPPMQTPR